MNQTLLYQQIKEKPLNLYMNNNGVEYQLRDGEGRRWVNFEKKNIF